MSDASPNRPTETLEEKIEEKVELKVEAKVEQKVEQKIEPKPVEEPPPDVQPALNPEVAIEPPAPQREVKLETPQRQEPRPPAPTTSAPQVVPEETAAIPAAPTPGPVISQEFSEPGEMEGPGRPRCSSATSAIRRRPSRAASRALLRCSSFSIGRGA